MKDRLKRRLLRAHARTRCIWLYGWIEYFELCCRTLDITSDDADYWDVRPGNVVKIHGMVERDPFNVTFTSWPRKYKFEESRRRSDLWTAGLTFEEPDYSPKADSFSLVLMGLLHPVNPSIKHVRAALVRSRLR